MAEAFCTTCGGPIGASDRFCASCGTGIGGLPAGPASTGPATVPATSATPLAPFDTTALVRFGRIARAVALLAFLLPWVTVSCAGQTIASVSGVRLATGVVTIRNPMSGAIETHAGTANWAVLLTALAIALALLVSFLPARRAAALLGLALSTVAAILAIYAVTIDIPQQLAAGFRDRTDGGGEMGSALTHSVEQAIRVDSGSGFWLTLLALAVACVVDWRIQKRRASPPS